MSKTKKACSIGLMYQKIEHGQTINKIRVCFIDFVDGDDQYDTKAKGERYFASHEDFKEDLKDFNVVAWQIATANIT